MIKKKKKIKVPAAAFGMAGGSNWSQMLQSPQVQNMQYMQSLLNGTYQNPNQQYIQAIAPGNQQAQQIADQSYYNNAQNQFALDLLNKNPQGASNFTNAMNNSSAMQYINNSISEQQQTDAYASKTGGGGGGFSNMSVGDLAAATTGGIASIAGYGPKSEATNRDEAVTQSLADVSKGVSVGASMGSSFGHTGTMIGAGVGLGIGLIGRKGRDAEMTSFTDYDEGTLGSGLIGAFTNKGLRRQRERVKKNAMTNRSAVRGTGYLRNEYNEEYGDTSVDVFDNGGTTASLAYVDDGELISTPDGTVSKVPELGRPTDSNLVQLPGGSKILSDKLKVPGTKKTFAQVGEEMMATKKSKFNDIYAQNAAKLNEMNNKSIHDQLFEMQEAVKAKKGIKRKYKNAVIAAEDGDITLFNPHNVWRGQDPRGLKKYEVGERVTMPDGSTWEIIEPTSTLAGTSNSSYRARRVANVENETIDRNLPVVVVTPKKETTVKPTQYSAPRSVTKRKNTFKLNPSDWIGENDVTYNIDPDGWRREWTSEDLPLTETTITTTTDPKQSDKDPDRNPIDWTGIASGIAGLAPIISIISTSPEYQSAIYNPYASSVMQTMSNRRYDINPVLRDIERNRAISNYNADQMNTNTGANLAFRLQNAANTARAIADVRAQENNINNEYLGQYANTLNTLGEQWANESKRVQEANMANRAQARNIRRAGLSGLSQWAQNRELMRNQRNRDNMMMALYDPFLEAGFTTGDLTNFRNWLRRTNG